MECLLLDRIPANVSIKSPTRPKLFPSLEPHTDRKFRNLVYIGIFGTVQVCFTAVAASYFAAADGHAAAAVALNKAGGVFGFLSGLLGYYTVGHLMCQDATGFSFPMGDTSRFFEKNRLRLSRSKEHDV